jgi:hypothetical protein
MAEKAKTHETTAGRVLTGVEARLSPTKLSQTPMSSESHSSGRAGVEERMRRFHPMRTVTCQVLTKDYRARLTQTVAARFYSVDRLCVTGPTLGSSGMPKRRDRGPRGDAGVHSAHQGPTS